MSQLTGPSLWNDLRMSRSHDGVPSNGPGVLTRPW